jgi:hypothetical protein
VRSPSPVGSCVLPAEIVEVGPVSGKNLVHPLSWLGPSSGCSDLHAAPSHRLLRTNFGRNRQNQKSLGQRRPDKPSDRQRVSRFLVRSSLSVYLCQIVRSHHEIGFSCAWEDLYWVGFRKLDDFQSTNRRLSLCPSGHPSEPHAAIPTMSQPMSRRFNMGRGKVIFRRTG